MSYQKTQIKLRVAIHALGHSWTRRQKGANTRFACGMLAFVATDFSARTRIKFFSANNTIHLYNSVLLFKVNFLTLYMEFDTNVDNYTDDELLEFLNIPTTRDQTKITETIDEQLAQHAGNEELVKFYMDIKTKLIDPVQTTTKVIETEVTKGNINPDLKNTVSRMINVDSLYRETPLESLNNNYDTDNYVFQLNEPISNVVSLMLYSLELPQAWYTFVSIKGNTTFRLVMVINTVKHVNLIQITDGNYTPKSLMAMVSKLINSSDLFKGNEGTFSMAQDAWSGRLRITITGFNPNNIQIANFSNPNVYIGFVFHAPDLKTKINHNLGWNLGFRVPVVMFPSEFGKVETQVLDAGSFMDTAGPKYVILRLDDYKPNRLNKGLICINTKKDTKLKLPNYYTNDLSKFSITPTRVNVMSTTPRTLTASQQHTINSISKNNIIDIDRIKSPADSDIFAKIPIKRVTEWGVYTDGVNGEGTYSLIDGAPGKLITEWSGPIQLNIREYFGPVNINAFQVSLYDDKGMLIGLNGMDWSFTMIAKSLYQY
jgi:hypothetical protein